MSTITITVNDDEKVILLSEILKSMSFVESVDIDDDSELTAGEIQMVEERLEHYRNNPGAAKNWNDVYKELKTKYGK